MCGCFFFFKQKTAYEMRISDWSSDVCSSDLYSRDQPQRRYVQEALVEAAAEVRQWVAEGAAIYVCGSLRGMAPGVDAALERILGRGTVKAMPADGRYRRSGERRVGTGWGRPCKYRG